MTILDKYLFQIRSLKSIKLIRKDERELSYNSYLKDPNSITLFLKILKSHNDIVFYTYPKLANLSRIFYDYYKTLQLNYDFEIVKNDIIIDIGAHHGIVGIGFAKLGARVICFEPNPINFDILERNISCNPDCIISAENKAVASETKILEFNFGVTSTTGSLTESRRNWKNSSTKIDIQAISFADILENYQLDEIKLMKIDIEGGEYDFLLNVPPTFLRRINYYYIELHPTENYSPVILKNYFIQHGYNTILKPLSNDCVEIICKRN